MHINKTIVLKHSLIFLSKNSSENIILKTNGKDILILLDAIVVKPAAIVVA